jgi:hypothetical protein
MLDFREQGYERIDITKEIHAYNGYQIKGQVFTYVDFGVENTNDRINSEYINMARSGAIGWDLVVPGFLKYFCKTTPIPKCVIEFMHFIWIGQDGQTVWMLNERTQSNILLMILPYKLFESEILKEDTHQWNILPPKHLQFYDYRCFEKTKAETNVYDEYPILNLVKMTIHMRNPKKMLLAKEWIIRLACLCREKPKEKLFENLKNDEDFFVRTIARKHQKFK